MAKKTVGTNVSRVSNETLKCVLWSLVDTTVWSEERIIKFVSKSFKVPLNRVSKIMDTLE